MLNVLTGLPPHVLGFEAVGKVTDDDYRTVLVPALDAKRQAQEEIRLLYVLGEEFDGYTLGAMWNDAKLGLRDFKAWEKIALVSDEDWVENAVKALGWMVPGEVRVFELDELDEAREWVAD
jgi:hypothetical protein